MLVPKIARRILVLDADQIPTLTIARSLARLGCQVDVAGATSKPVSSYSNAVNMCFSYPDPLNFETEFITWLEAHLQANNYSLVIPVTERTLVPLSRHRQRFSDTAIAMASESSLSLVLDKTATFKLAEQIGVDTPQSIYVNQVDQLAEAAAQLTFPVVIKPSQSVAETGSRAYTATGASTGPTKTSSQFSKRVVEYASDHSSLIKRCKTCLQHSPVILQSYFEGLGAGIELIARGGKILYAFQHIRLHEVPLSGGGSSFRKSAEIEPELLEAATKLIAATKWDGVAMVEFKWNPTTREYRLMEINGRFWGSLPLAAAAGADFPAMLVDLMLTGDIGNYPDYRRGVYCRKLATDMHWLELVLRTRRNSYTHVPDPRQVLSDLALVFSPRHRFDTQCVRDPVPGLVEIFRLVSSYALRLSSVFSESWLTIRQRLLWRNGTVREKLRDADSVLFLCYGNINRSAAAEWLMRGMLKDVTGGKAELQLNSAGFHLETNRPADPRMVTVAAEQGVDLGASRSRCVEPELVRNSDVIFVMEQSHYRRLRLIDKDICGRTFLLGAGGGGSLLARADIPDPYNRDQSVYRACFARVKNAIGHLVEYLHN